jgi:hypothetical protein
VLYENKKNPATAGVVAGPVTVIVNGLLPK